MIEIRSALREHHGHVKELIVSFDCVEIGELADFNETVAAEDLADRIAATLTRLIQSTHVTPQ